MELDLKMGGINYNVKIDVEDDCVTDVFEVRIFDGEIFFPLDMNHDELMSFYDKYVDELNEAYQDKLLSVKEAHDDMVYDQMKEELYKPGED